MGVSFVSIVTTGGGKYKQNKKEITNKVTKMRDFERCNKSSGVHWLKKSISKLLVRIKLKPLNGISLPHFEEFSRNANPVESADQEATTTNEYLFKWQQKIFSSWELTRYSDSYNCITECERNYNNLVQSSNHEPSKVFTYVNEDNFLPKSNNHKLADNNKFIDNLSKCLAALNISQDAQYSKHDTISVRDLFKSEENLLDNENEWTSMHIVLDSSEYNEDKQLLLKQDSILLSLHYNDTQHCLIVTPDVNDLGSNPYQVVTSSGLQLKYEYSIEFDYEEEDADCNELVDLLQKLSKKWLKLHRNLIDFDTPPLNQRRYFVNLEILTAEDFEMDNLYIQYTIKIPEGVTSSGTLHGNTHASAALTTDGATVWHYGHLLELQLESELDCDPEAIDVYLEAISTDWWGRHRTEGYTYLPLALQPGRGSRVQGCVRPEELDPVEAESRRFFVGGCHLLKDLDVLKTPRLQDAAFRYRGTGRVGLRWGVTRQAPPGPAGLGSAGPGAAGLGAAGPGAGAVLRRYQEARQRLAAAMGGGEGWPV